MRIASFILLLFLAAPLTLAQTCTTEWAQPVDGSWADDTRWTAGVPDAGDIACITAAGTYTVTFDGPTQSLQHLEVGGASGTQTLIVDGTFSSLGSGRIGPNGRLVNVNSAACATCDGLPTIEGTLLIEGELVHNGSVGLISASGTVDVAPGGRLLLNASAQVGSATALLRIRGLFEADCSSTCDVRAPLEVEDGTVRLLTGRLDLDVGGTADGLTIDTAADTDLYFFQGSIDGEPTRWVLEGTVTGTAEGAVWLSGTEVAAGPAGATLDVGGTGLSVRALAALTSAGGDFLNTGLVVFLHNAPRVRGVTVANEGTFRIDGPNVVLTDGAVIDNRPGGTLDLVDQGGITDGPDGGQIVSTGPIVARLEDNTFGRSSISVPVVLDGATVEVNASRLTFNAGTLRDVTFEVAEENEMFLSSGIFVVEGTLNGDIQGTLRLTSGELQAGADGATLALGGTGLTLSGSSGTTLASAGGAFLNTGLVVLRNNVPRIRGVTLANEAEIRVENATVRLNEAATVENRPDGTVVLSAGGSFRADDDTPTTVVNEGLVLKTNAGTSDFDETLRSQLGSELRVLTGRLDLDPPAEHAFPEGTLLTGTSEVRFISDLVAEGTISPGTDDEPLATLEFVSSFKLGPTARLVMDIDEDGQNDLVVPASGQANTLLGGTLVVRPRPGFTPAPGDEWTIVLRSANPYDILGEFESIEVEGDLPEGVGFVTEKPNPGVVVLRAVTGVTIEALAEDTSEDGAPVPFVIRTAQPVPAGEALDVPLAFEGTATRYLDYVVDFSGTAARIPAGETETTVTVFPLRDDLDEDAETITLRILPDGDAAPGDPGAATLALADGPPTSALAVGGIAPSRGGNGGQVSASVFGQGFAPGSQVRLEQGGTVIEGDPVTPNATGTGATARFDLTGAPLGSYDVVVESGGDASTLAGGFVVEESAGMAIWADINGTPNPRQNRWSTYTLTVGNAGNQDFYDTVVLLRVTADVEYEIDGPILLDTEEVPPDPEDHDYVGLNVETASVIPIYLYRIPAGGVNTVSVRIRPTGPVNSGAGVSYELYPPDPEASFTWSGDFDDIDLDTQEGHITNWVAFFGAVGWAFDFLLEENDPLGKGQRAASDALHKGASASLRLVSGDLNNEWDRPREDLSMDDLVDYYADITNLGDNPLDAAAVALLAGAEGGINMFLNPISSLASLRISTATGNPWAVGFSAVRLGLSFGLTAIGEKAPGRIICNFVAQDCGDGNGSGGSGGSTGGPGGGPEGGVGGSAGGKVGGSVDPNDKLGPAGYGDLRYRTTDAPAMYTIRFENLDTATFPAQEVVIVDELDTSVYDLSTFSLGPITLPGRVIEPPIGAQSFSTTVDLAPELPALLVVNASLDSETGRVVWTFATLDPETNDLPEDGTIGFLPPNQDPPEGEGDVSFTIEMLPDLTTETDVANLAEIVFDLNEPIVTPVWGNRIDHDEPVSEVQPIEPSDEWPVTIEVAGSDLGSGVHSYTLFVAEGNGPFEIYATSPEPAFEFEGEEDVLYGFYSITVDNVLNVEPPKDEAEATFAFGVSNEDDPSLPREIAFDAPYPNPASRTATLRWGLPETGSVDLRVYDVLGREVARLADGDAHAAGWHTTRWKPDLASGAYFVRLRAETAREHKTLVHRVVIVR